MALLFMFIGNITAHESLETPSYESVFMAVDGVDVDNNIAVAITETGTEDYLMSDAGPYQSLTELEDSHRYVMIDAPLLYSYSQPSKVVGPPAANMQNMVSSQEGHVSYPVFLFY